MSLTEHSPKTNTGSLTALPFHLILDIASYMEVLWIEGYGRPYPRAGIIPRLSKRWLWLYNYRIAVLVRKGGFPVCHYLDLRGTLDGPTYRFNWNYRLTGYAFYRSGVVVGDHKFEFIYRHDKPLTVYNGVFYYPPENYFYPEEDEDSHQTRAINLLRIHLFNRDTLTFAWIKELDKPWRIARDMDKDEDDEDYDPDSALEERMYNDGVIVTSSHLLRRLQSFASLSRLKILFSMDGYEMENQNITLLGNE